MAQPVVVALVCSTSVFIYSGYSDDLLNVSYSICKNSKDKISISKRQRRKNQQLRRFFLVKCGQKLENIIREKFIINYENFEVIDDDDIYMGL